jgi:putative oxidoreductase
VINVSRTPAILRAVFDRSQIVFAKEREPVFDVDVRDNSAHIVSRCSPRTVYLCREFADMRLKQSSIHTWAPIPIRLIVGYGFMTHGFLKLCRGVGVFAAALSGLGVPAPDIMAWITVVIEIACGLAVLLGAYVRLVSIPMVVVLLVALFTVHLQFGFSSIKFLAVTADGPQFGKPGIECDLLYLACLATLTAGGSGPFSIDGWRNRFARASASRAD